MALSAYFVEDPITRIVSITMTQAPPPTVVYAEWDTRSAFQAGGLYVGKPSPSTGQEWSLVEYKVLPFSWVSFAPVETSGATLSTYLVADGNTRPSTSGTFPTIWSSNDGEHWSARLTLSGNAGDIHGFLGLVWNPDNKMFYAMSIQAGSLITVPVTTLTIWQSATGLSWSQKQQWASAVFDDISPIATEAFKALCVKPSNKGGIPDGHQGYDANKKILIKPAHNHWSTSIGPHGYSCSLDGITVEINDEVDSGYGAGLPEEVNSVSFASGVWNAVVAKDESNEIWISTDDGKNWTQKFTTPGFLPAGIIGGTISEESA